MTDKRRILICEDVTGTGIDRLKGKYQVQYEPDLWKKIPELEEKIRGYDGLIVRNQTRVNASLLSKAKTLRIIGRAGAGYDNIDVPAASQEGVVVSFQSRRKRRVRGRTGLCPSSVFGQKNSRCRPFDEERRLGAKKIPWP